MLRVPRWRVSVLAWWCAVPVRHCVVAASDVPLVLSVRLLSLGLEAFLFWGGGKVSQPLQGAYWGERTRGTGALGPAQQPRAAPCTDGGAGAQCGHRAVLLHTGRAWCCVVGGLEGIWGHGVFQGGEAGAFPPPLSREAWLQAAGLGPCPLSPTQGCVLGVGGVLRAVGARRGPGALARRQGQGRGAREPRAGWVPMHKPPAPQSGQAEGCLQQIVPPGYLATGKGVAGVSGKLGVAACAAGHGARVGVGVLERVERVGLEWPDEAGAGRGGTADWRLMPQCGAGGRGVGIRMWVRGPASPSPVPLV